MVSKLEIDSLVERLKSDASDHKGEDAHSWGLYGYLKQLLEDNVLSHPAAIGSAKRAVTEDINSLSDAQLVMCSYTNLAPMTCRIAEFSYVRHVVITFLYKKIQVFLKCFT
ncbi:hypothetical protein MOE65_08305 [Bacillus inaquosorum]|uniref:hypothetical protein n=1 Tax=Bacillus inaquosorum TaxID=483913 RepID=UPI002281944C|nr:hypothetical protein [Bacillus inaquosorum]MCY9070449.1 hypothetical protein [Bacillus inaquosorum]